ncbi:MAG TPA: hypothetical protein VK826_02895 [Bacteroidia bacterium]|nr:hypothetical protein [Bacteroidia bacterium]
MGYITYTRPTIITVLAVIGFILVLFSMPSVFSPDTRDLGDYYPALFGLLISFRFIAYVGIWHFKRWGVELFLYTYFANVVIGILLDSLSPIGVIYRFVELVVLAIYYRKMDRNL